MVRRSDSGWSARAISASIERSVQDGRMRAGEALPPVRELAHKLKVSPGTVAAAYRHLRVRGLVSGQGRRGTRIVPRPAIGAQTATQPVADGVVDLASGNPDPALLPSLASAVRSLDTGPVLYDRPPHLPSLRAFAASEFEADGVPSAALTLVAGALDAIARLLQEHLRPGDRVAIEDPCVPLIHDALLAAGLVPIGVAIDDEGPVAPSLYDALRHGCRALIVSPRAQNPSGAAMSPARAIDVRALLRRHPDLLLIENDAFGPVSGVPLVSVIDPGRRCWAHVKSTAKFLGPDLRVAFVAGDASTISRVEGRYAAGPRRVSYILQQIVLSLWSDPSAGRQLARASDTYRRRRAALCTALTARGIRCGGTSGFNVWVPVREEAAVTGGLAQRGWGVAAGEPFRLRAAPGVRITAAALDESDAQRLAADLAAVYSPGRLPAA